MREIGSEFWDVPTVNKDNCIFPESTQWFLSGRSALQSIIKEIKHCHTVAIPSWCCDSMIKPFMDAGMEVHFYPVYWKERLIQEISLESDVLLLMDYFGYTSSLPDLSGYEGIVIRDVTHSIFSTIYDDAAYYFGSLRKWCGVWTGGFAWTRDTHELASEKSNDYGYTTLRIKAMQLKNRYINGYADTNGYRVSNKEYLRMYGEAEERLENVGISTAADRDVRLAHKLDINGIKNRRNANAKVLMSAFSEWLVFSKLKDADCTMFVPILVPKGKRDKLHKYLIKNGIYCPVHWPESKYHRFQEKTETIYKNEISLVCDQRYTEEDMFRMVNTINQFWREV